MKQIVNKLIAFLIAFVFAFTGTFMFNGTGVFVYGESDEGSDGQDTTYSQDGGVLGAIGIDTSVMPETYDPDDTDNPYGSDVTTLSEMNEMVKIDTESSTPTSYLYGHNKKLDGNYGTLKASPSEHSVTGPETNKFVAAENCDVNGSGRDSAVVLVYCNYSYDSAQDTNDTGTIYMKIYDPTRPNVTTEPFVITDNVEAFKNNHVQWNYLAQSQLQVATGDFDNDTVEEIAVYVPAAQGSAPRVAIYDLTNGGANNADPFNKASWQNVWNYVLPKTSAQVVTCDPPRGHHGDDLCYISNFYNNIDLSAADADNDGSCDLVISYGASDVDGDALHKVEIERSLASRSVILYGSNGADRHGVQMLRDSQELQYGGDPLIRVSFAFGDLNGDGNEEMIMGGQLQSEQSDNSSRVLAKFDYDSSSGNMISEGVQKMDIINGQWIEQGEGDNKTKSFASENGWDGYYHSLPVMNTNVAVGKIFGQSSNVKIYMDSVLYSYDSTFSIVDEMEDPSPEDPNDSSNTKKKGSAILSDLHGFIQNKWEQLDYYEYGASMGNYTGSLEDYLIVHRVSQMNRAPNNVAADEHFRSDACVLVATESDENDEGHTFTIDRTIREFKLNTQSGAVTLLPADTDMDSCVATYTGEHNIQYQDPHVLAVIASAPYFKDVADYDESGDMLEDSETTYGTSTGSEDEYSQTVTYRCGVYSDNDISFGAYYAGLCDFVGININADLGHQWTEEYGHSANKSFEVTYGTTAGEDQVVLFSTPTENYTYNVTTGQVDDDGNVTIAKFKQTVPEAHKPVTQVIPLDRYKEILKTNTDYLPDVTKYLTSKPGDPSTYPKSSTDIPSAVTDSWKGVSKGEYAYYAGADNQGNPYNDMMVSDALDYSELDDPMKPEDYTWYQPDTWEGAGFGNGRITQTMSAEHDNYKRTGGGTYFDLEVGAHFKSRAGLGFVAEYETNSGIQFNVDGDEGIRYSHSKGVSCSGTVANMPRSAESYGYDFSWSLLEYSVHDTAKCIFPVVTYMVNDVTAPPKLPDSISQDFDRTTDSQICLTWTYTDEEPQCFEIYRYKDFPQGGGDELVGTVAGSTGKVRKDSNGNTITNNDGKPIKEYSFIEEGLTADTKYNYRMKVKGEGQHSESIYSQIIEARTDVSEKPALTLNTDKLTIYPDGQYQLTVNLADPQNYETSMDYQWQKYDTKTLKWEDMDGRTKQNLAFTKCNSKQAGQYRCRVNLVRKHESSPQYISAYTNVCEVSFSLREVVFDPISVFEGTGSSFTNTGIMVGVKNASSSSTTKPTGKVTFHLTGPNGTLTLYVPIDQQTGIARLDSIEDELSSISQEGFVNGGYVVTAEYGGDGVFKPAVDEEEYHYLRNITACDFLSMHSTYCFGEDVIPSTNLFRYTEQEGGAIKKEDITETMTALKLYKTDENGTKGDLVETIDLSSTGRVAKIPLNAQLKKRAYVEAYVTGSEDPVAFQIIKVAPKKVQLTLSGKVSGGGNLLNFYSFDDVSVTGGCDFNEANMVPEGGGEAKALKDLLVFKYYEDSGSYICDSTQTEAHKSEFIPARYKVDLAAKDNASKQIYETFYDFNNPAKAEFLIVGSYYEVTAIPSNEAAGSVRLISPFLQDDVTKLGFPGGTKITLKALPSPGFRIKKWIIADGQGGTQTQDGGDLLIYTLRSDPTLNSDGQVTVTAVFEPKNQTLTYEAKGDGTIEVNPYFASGSTVLEGTQMQFTARANDGWHFKEWRWTNFGGSDSVSLGNTGEGNINSKTYTMGDTAAAVYAVFFRDTIDLDLDDHLRASYINDGSNPLEDVGEEIAVTGGREVPKGTTVRVVTAPGYEPAQGAEWIVNVTTPDGTSQVEVEKIMSGSSEGCEFDLPADVTACSVQLETEKGYYSVGLEGTDVTYAVSLDGEKVPESQLQQMLQRIEGGTLVEVQAIPVRGKLFKRWMIDGVANDDAPQSYSFTLKDSVTLEASLVKDEHHTLKFKGTGNGNGLYTITDRNGDVISGNFGNEEIEVDAYKGEKLTVCDDPSDLGHILTAIKMNDVRQDLVDGVFTLDSITEDAEFVCSFQPTTYCTISFQNEIDGSVQPELYIGEDKMNFTDTVDIGSGEDLQFSIVIDKDYPCHVRNKGELIEPTGDPEEVDEGTKYKYNYTFNVKETTTLTVDDRNEYTISTWEEFDQFMKEMNTLNGAGGRPTATITADITMPDDATLTTCGGEFRGTLDGQGHTISGLKLEGENGAPASAKSSLFGSIAKGGVVKDLTIEGYNAYVDEYVGAAGEGETRLGSALIARINNGTISGVTLKNCTLRQNTTVTYTAENPAGPELAGIAAYNTGTIEACAVTGLKLKAPGRDSASGNTVGSAVVLKNHVDSAKGSVNGCYVEDLKICSEDDYAAATDTIIADDNPGAGSGAFIGNYFRVDGNGPDGDSGRGDNVTTLVDDPADLNSVLFAGNLAYHINKAAGDLWGIHKPSAQGNGEGIVTPEIIPLAFADENCKTPVKAEFKYNETDYVLYLYPDKWKLPGRDKFGNDENLKYWKVGEEGTIAYSIEYDSVEITQDTTFIGVSALDGVVAELYGVDSDENKTGITCYSVLKDALDAAKTTDLENPHLDIVGECTMDSGSFTVKAGMVMTVCDGAAMTMNRQASIANKGTFTCAEGGTLHKYGTMNNSGTINVDGTFINYGSKLKNNDGAEIVHRENIICEPHILGERHNADQPDAEGNWTSTATCEVCGYEDTITIGPDPDDPDSIDHIEVFRYPTTSEYKTGDEFDDSGLVVAAVLKSGCMAKVNSYTMTIRDGTSDPVPIIDGDILSKHGAMQITASYKGFTCSFPIVVRSSVTGIAIADGERELNKGENLQLEAVITPDTVHPVIQWTSDDESVATVNENGLVTGVKGGQAKITATVDDMSASCTVVVHEAATSLELDEYEILVPKDGYGVIAARVAPATADGEVTWTVSDPSIAGVCVTDAETGEMSVVDSTMTKLSQGGASEANSYIAVSGIGEGDTVITVAVKDDRGLTIHKNCTVHVQDAEGKWVRILKDGAAVSGKTVTIDTSEETAAFRAESSEDEDSLAWSSVDDIEDPVIDVSNNGKVTLKRSGMAVVKVKSDMTNLSDICVLNVVSMPASITLSAGEIHMAKGVVKMLSASMSPEKADGAVKWTSSDKKVATVSDSGGITGMGEGTAIITAESTADPDVKAECVVTVYEPEIQLQLSEEVFIYDGTVKIPAVTVTSGSQTLASNITESNSRVMLIYEGAMSGPGKVKVTAIGRDDGMGVATGSYKINVKPTKIKKVKRQKKALKVTWVKGKKGLISGYQVQVATDPDFTKNKKTKTIKKIKTKTKKIKKLKKKTQYYVRVRTFLKVGGTTYYSDWSPAVIKKTK